MDLDAGETASMFRKMDNGGYRKDPEKGTELVETQTKSSTKVSTTKPSTSTPPVGAPLTTLAASSTPPPPPPSTSCRPEVCQAARSRYTPPTLSGSPWNARKSIFLIVILGSLIVWIVVFTILSQLDLL